LVDDAIDCSLQQSTLLTPLETLLLNVIAPVSRTVNVFTQGPRRVPDSITKMTSAVDKACMEGLSPDEIERLVPTNCYFSPQQEVLAAQKQVTAPAVHCST
jgi:hypothetical protein